MKVFTAFFLALFVLVGCANVPQIKDGEEFYFIYFSSEYMKLDKTDENSVYPWIQEEFEDDPRNEGAILVSHSCGFFEIDIIGFKLKALGDDLREVQDENLRVFYPGGEFCNISDFLSYSPKLVKIKAWNGKYFALDYREVNHIGDDQLIIFDRYDIKNIGITSSYREFDPKLASEACRKLDYLSPKKLKVMLNDPNVIQIDGKVCYKKGVFLHEIINL